VAQAVGCCVINGGDGTNQHPTQALLDALTIRRRLGRIEGLTVAICGDIRHSRVANSNRRLLPRLGAQVRLVAPPGLLPDDSGAAAVFSDMDEGIDGADVVMMLRIQRERMEDALTGLLGDFHGAYGLTRQRLDRAAPEAMVMHPGPMNRGIEISSELADDRARSLILDQVESGVALRMACLDLLTRTRRQA
jgi:aspartate carbamoyltransferase catalytic subunit